MTSKAYLLKAGKTILMLAITISVGWACADFSSFWFDRDPVYFSPDIADTSHQKEIYYFSHNVFNTGLTEYGMHNDLKRYDTNYTENIHAWADYVQHKVSHARIDTFLYHSPLLSKRAVAHFKEFLKQYQTDSLITFLLKHKDKTALTYLYTAKQNEFGYETLDDGWNYFPNYDYYGIDSLNQGVPLNPVKTTIIEQLHQPQPAFFMRRYAFQLMRNFRYNQIGSNIDSLFLQYFQTGEKDFLYYEAMNYACDGLENDHQYTKANYYAAILFYQYPNKRISAYQNCHRTTPIDRVLAICPGNKQKSMVYTLYAFKDFYPNALYITKAAELDPTNTLVNDLIIREINKLDRKLMPGKHGEDDEDDSENNELEDEDNHFTYPDIEENSSNLISLLTHLKESQPAHSAFYTLCLAHVYSQMEQYNNAYIQLLTLQPAKLNAKLAAQYYLTSYIVFIKTANLRHPKNLVIASQKLQLIERYQTAYYNPRYILQGTKLLLQERLINIQDFSRAYLIGLSLEEQYGNFDVIENYARGEDIDTIFAILKKPANDLDKYLARFYTRKPNDINLRSVQGSLYLRQNNFVQAHLVFKQVNTTFIPINYYTLNTNPDGHPFYPYYYDLPADDEREYLSPEEFKRLTQRALTYRLVYNNYSITREILRLMVAIGRNEGNIAENYYNLACLNFEITYHGRAYKAVNLNNHWGMEEMAYLEYREPKYAYYTNYYGCENAIRYFEHAKTLSKDPELTAKILYALYRCVHYKDLLAGKEESTDNLSYLLTLHDKYSFTQYYQVKECWGLNAYVDALRK
jgi:hypothetical protein